MSFKDIKGQDKAIQILNQYIIKSCVENAYLFVGPDDVGKTTVAKTLAKVINCLDEAFDTFGGALLRQAQDTSPKDTEQRRSETTPSRPARNRKIRAGKECAALPSLRSGLSKDTEAKPKCSINPEQAPDFSPECRRIDSCDRCISCQKIDNGQHPDIHIIDNASDAIKIEHIRQLQKEINLKSYEARKKVFIINNAHNLTAEAAGAVLKTLEEPAGNSLIVLITSKPALLFKTITSRCKVVKFVPLQRVRLEEILRNDYVLNKDTAHFLAYFCEGRLGYALRLKETDILNEKNRIIDEVISAKKPDLGNLSTQNRESARYHLNVLASWFRDIYLTKIGMPYSELIHLDRKTELTRLINRYAFFDLYEIINSISEAVSFLEQNVNIKLLMSNLSEHISYACLPAGRELFIK